MRWALAERIGHAFAALVGAHGALPRFFDIMKSIVYRAQPG